MLEQAQEPERRRASGTLLGFTMFGGVLLPATSILIETTTHICAQEFFDPIPTVWHVLVVIFVPLANLQVWLALLKGRTERGALLGLTNAAAIGVSIFYTIVYLPLLPLALIALIFVIGILPMAPVFSLLSGILMRRQLKRIAPSSFAVKTACLVSGLALAFTVVALVELPITLTRMGLQMAASESADERARGLRWLRTWGNRDYLLRACYERTGEATDLVGHLFSLRDPVTPEEARQIYYRVTGETFNTSLPPKRLKGQWQPQDTFDFDPDQGGTVIAGKVKGLSLAASRIDGSVDSDAGLAYIEWTLSFKNSSATQREARAQVQLPPGGVVSRLTLWVNGEEREAAFAGRTQTRQAYQTVVRVERRDPVLVTTSGRDRILVQCFPVPANGGEMKIRFGVTTPLVLEDKSQGALRLPHFLERNFSIPEKVAHTVWIESVNPLRAADDRLQAEQPATNLYALRGAFSDSELSAPTSAVRLSRPSEITEARTRDPHGKNGEIIRQLIEEREASAPSRIVVVLDTSRQMKAHAREAIAALKNLPPNIETKVLLADGNGVYEEGVSQRPISGSPQEIGRQLESVQFEGGADNVPALIKAWDLASEKPGGVIVWLHGPQSLLLQPVEALQQRWERSRRDHVILYAVQTENGPDRVEEKLDGIRAIRQLPRIDGLQADLQRLFAQLAGERKVWEFKRTSERPEALPDAPNAAATSTHLARLWANDEVARIINGREKDWTEKAILLAAQYQLVTPVSGAVVLETKEQYQRAGLKPVDAGTVPTIPEPEMIMLMAVVGAIFLWLFYRQKMMQRSGVRR